MAYQLKIVVLEDASAKGGVWSGPWKRMRDAINGEAEESDLDMGPERV